MLPGLDGLTVCRELRRKHLMPILMLTARGDVADRVTGLEVGADDYLGKPFSIVELAARVASLLRRVALDTASSSSDLAAAHVRDPRSRPGRPPGHACRVVARPQPPRDGPARGAAAASGPHVLARLPARASLGADFDGLDRAVDTQMVRLRRKLGDLGVCIETVWGVGYRFRPELHETT